MKVKIKHKSMIFRNIFIADIVLTVILWGVGGKSMGNACFYIGGIIGLICLILMGVQSMLFTTLTVENGTLKIDYPFGGRELPVSSITGLRFERRSSTSFSRSSAENYEYRVFLEITAEADGKASVIKLNDDATGIINENNPFSAEYYVKPDEEVGLCSIYRCLSDLTGINGGDEIKST